MGTKKKVHIATIEIYKEGDCMQSNFSTKAKKGISQDTLRHTLETITKHIFDMLDGWDDKEEN